MGEEYDDGYDSKESFEKAESDKECDLCDGEGCGTCDPNHEDYVDPEQWFICSICHGDGHHARDMGDFTMSEFNETFDDEESRADYFSGRYDRPCIPCGGTGKIKGRDLHKIEAENERDLIRRTGRNSAGEPC
jgi:hypothetical protein